jgi:dienelactone hydrolase
MVFYAKVRSKWVSVIILLALVGALVAALLPVNIAYASDPPPPDAPGPYHVGFYWVSYQMPDYGTYSARIYYPATRDGWLAPKDPSGGPYPGIVVANGLYGAEWNIKWVPQQLTSHGYVAICFTPPNPGIIDTTQWAQGFTGGIAKLKEQNSCWLSPMRGLLDTGKFGVIGLSMGGGGCIEATGTAGSEINAAVALAPASSDVSMVAAQNIAVPIQLQVGSIDGMVSRVLHYYNDLIPNTTVKEYVEINGGTHSGFIDEFFACIAVFLGIDTPGTITFAQQRYISGKYFTAWFNYHLKGENGYYPYIFGGKASQDRIDGILSDLRFNIH